jgi:hypothetical protein
MGGVFPSLSHHQMPLPMSTASWAALPQPDARPVADIGNELDASRFEGGHNRMNRCDIRRNDAFRPLKAFDRVNGYAGSHGQIRLFDPRHCPRAPKLFACHDQVAPIADLYHLSLDSDKAR